MAFVGLNEAILVGGAILALVLGPKKLPELAGALGKSKQEYKTSMRESNNGADHVSPNEQEIKDVSQ